MLTDDSCVQKSCEDIGCREIVGKLPLLSSTDDEPKEALPADGTLLSEFCDRTCVGFNSGPHGDVKTGKALEGQCHSDTGSSLDSSLEWSEDVAGDSREDASQSIQGNAINCGGVSPSKKPRGVNRSLYSPYLLTAVTDPAPENSDLLSEARKSPAIEVSRALLECPCEHRASQQPVEFQGHQVKGSATSGVMVRGHSLQRGCTQFPDSIDYENFLTDTCVWTPGLPSTYGQTDFLQD